MKAACVKYKICVLLGIIFPLCLFAQPPKKSRILFLLDASSSMTYNWNAKYNRFDIASNILLKIIDSVYALNNEVEFAVRAYGTQYPAQEKNCTDTRLEVPFNIQNVMQINTRLRNMKPLGFSPIAYSLRQAADNELSDARLYDYSIIFITDGGESCNGDVCNTFREFLEKRIKVKPYIIGLDKNEQLNRLYECMGSYIKVADSADIDEAVKLIVDANRPLLNKPKTLNLPTIFAKPAIVKDSLVAEPNLPVEKPVRVAGILPRLRIIPFKIKVKDAMIVKAAYIIQVKPPQLSINMGKTDDPVKAVVPGRRTDVIPKISPAAYFATKQNIKWTNAKSIAWKNKDKVELRFDLTVPPPPVVRKNDIFPSIRPARFRSDKKVFSPEINAKALAIDKSKSAVLRFEFTPPLVRKNTEMTRLRMPKIWIATPVVTTPKMQAAKINKNQKAVLRFDVEMPKKPELTFIRPTKFHMGYGYAYRMPTLTQRRPMQQKAILRFDNNDFGLKRKDSLPKIISAPPVQSTIESEFSVAVENSTETQVQVFFVGRNGKQYPAATPELVFKSQPDNKIATSFRRQVMGNQPVPQKIAPGKYNVVVAGYNDLYVNNVTIEANKLNKVTIKVSDGTLSFAYVGNNKRPVEYNAIVNRRFAAGATVLQKCVDKLPYDPGTYYVEINTLPASKFSIDMSFGALYELQIPEPGTLQITNSSPIGMVKLQYEHGDMYEVFYNMNLTGNVSAQILTLQPGPYKVIYPVDPKMPQMGTKVADFKIQSNKTTLLELP